MTNQSPLSVRCPTCLASAGKGCRSILARALKGQPCAPHQKRVIAAIWKIVPNIEFKQEFTDAGDEDKLRGSQ